MIHAGTIEEGSEFTRKLTSLARKGDKDLIAAFEASCDGEFFNPLSFDVAFFLDNARDIVAERAVEENKNNTH